MEVNDWRLLREYVDNGSQAAFGKLVEKHMALVYWTCRRDLRDAHLAEDATQNVFLLLARKAPVLSPKVSISGWLFQASRFVSRDLYRGELRRLRQEEAVQMHEKEAQETAAWREVDPWLNDTLSSLKSADREAILLRYFEGLSIPDVAATLGTSETNARKRLSRAIERLRCGLLKQGIGVSSVALAALLAEHPARAVPSALHSATLSALSSGAKGPIASHFHALVLKKGAFLLMQTAKQKIIASAIGIMLLGAVVTVPIAGWKMYRAHQVAAAVGNLGFSDHTGSSSPAASLSPSSAINEIKGDYKQIIEGFNNGDVTPLASVSAPNISVWSSKNQTPSAGQPFSTDAGAQMQPMNGGRWSRIQEILLGHPDMRGTLTLTALTVRGNQAVGVSNMRWAAIANAQDHAPAGKILALDETDQFDWQNRGGKWVIVKITTLSLETHTV